jgi:tRNA pseudouridine38-40 synthase
VPRTLRLTVAYDGAGFHGFARQPGLRTVEGVLRAALGRTFSSVDRLAVAGRTDAGVHALGQVVSVVVDGAVPTESIAQVLDDALPGDVGIRAVSDADDGFHARHSARARAYVYRVRTAPQRRPLDAQRVLHRPWPVDDAALADLAALLPGTHDFTAFTPTETEHADFVRTVHHAAWVRVGEELRFTIAADRFLRHQVRTLVGTMFDLARAGGSEELAALLAGAPRAAAGETAPPHGLYLGGVRFEGEPAGVEVERLEVALSEIV